MTDTASINKDNCVANDEAIELSLPLNPAYVSAARLTASSIANRMKFDIEDIEDIKAAVSEACTYLIRHNATPAGMFRIVFSLNKLLLDISLSVGGGSFSDNDSDDTEIGLVMIKALMDDVVVNESPESGISIKLRKYIKDNLHLS